MSNPNDAIQLGIGMVFQHFQLVPVMTVAENVMLGSETIKRGLLDTQQVAERITELSQRYGLAVDPTRWSKTCLSACASASRLSRRSTATPISSSWTSRQRS